MSCSAFTLLWHFVVTVSLGLWETQVTSIPLRVTARRPPGEPPRPRGRYYPVGRDRFAQVWARVAAKVGLSLSEDGQTMRATAGRASLTVQRTYGGRGYALRFELTWPSLGIDLHVAERSWTDFAGAGWHGPSDNANAKLTVRGREREQLEALFDARILDALSAFSEVTVGDDHAHLTLPIAGTNLTELEWACRSAVSILGQFAEAQGRVPPPRTMAASLEAWRAFTDRMSGTLQTGSMSVHGCVLGVDRFSVETHWAEADHPLATVVVFPFDPRLEAEPREDDPSLSPRARALLRTLRSQAPDLEIARERLFWREPGGLLDPAPLLPKIEGAAAFIRALRGRSDAGPFR